MFQSVSDTTKQCKGKQIRMYTHLYGDLSYRNGGDKVKICLHRIGMLIHFCNDKTRSERSNAAFCLPLELLRITVWIVDWQLKLT
jgi:hypothetical protein